MNALRQAAEFYYDACGFKMDRSLDPQDSLEVLRRAFVSFPYCDDFSFVLSLVTGWKCVRTSWNIPGRGSGRHSLVRAPNDRLLDVTGWTDEAALARRYADGSGLGLMFENVTPSASSIRCRPGEEAQDEDVTRIVGVIRNLPYAPYGEAWFRKMADAFVVSSASSPSP